MNLKIIFLFINFTAKLAAKSGNNDKKKSASKDSTCVAGYCLAPDYNRLELPNGPGNVTHVSLNLEVLDVLRVDEKKFSVMLSMYFGVYWTEHRLNITRTSPAMDLPIDMNYMRNLWLPNIFVYDLVSFNVLECLEKLAGLWIVKDKKLFYNQATHVTFMCPMRFNKFPLDEQICKFKVGSSNYDDTRMVFGLENLDYNAENGNTILDYKFKVKPLVKEDTILLYGSANYSIAGFQIILRRNVAKYLYIYYLPSGLFVVVSWSSFLIPPEIVPGRMALLVTLFLVLTNIFNTITNISPNAEGMTAISSWMIACMFFVFGALLEYAGILYFLLMRKTENFEKKRQNLNTPHSKSCALHPSSEVFKKKEELAGLDQSQILAKIDTYFLYIFPIVFFLFNVIYWPYWTF